MLSAGDVNLALTSGLLSSVLLAGLVVFTYRWHRLITADTSNGIQNVHLDSTPRIGGLGIYLSLWVAMMLLDDGRQQLLFWMLVAALPAFLFGLAEDMTHRVSIKLRLMATMLSGILAWWLTGYELDYLGIPVIDSILAITPIAVIFTAFAVGGVANSINLIDGFNGLASGTLMICLAGLGLMAASVGDWEIARLTLIIGATILGFFLVNFPFGRLFLGDGGAYMLGFLLAWVAVMVAMRHPGTITPAAVLLVCSYPVLETVFSMVRRHYRGLAIDRPDRLHLHSLVYRRVVPKIAGKYCGRTASRPSRTVCNAATSPVLWLFCAVPVTAGVMLHDNAVACWFAFVLTAIAYDVIYRRLSQFRWTILGVPLGKSPKISGKASNKHD